MRLLLLLLFGMMLEVTPTIRRMTGVHRDVVIAVARAVFDQTNAPPSTRLLRPQVGFFLAGSSIGACRYPDRPPRHFCRSFVVISARQLLVLNFTAVSTLPEQFLTLHCLALSNISVRQLQCVSPCNRLQSYKSRPADTVRSSDHV